jgi:hypothetical protein
MRTCRRGLNDGSYCQECLIDGSYCQECHSTTFSDKNHSAQKDTDDIMDRRQVKQKLMKEKTEHGYDSKNNVICYSCH